MSAEKALYTILIEKIKQDALVLPTLPEIALKVRRAADDPEVNISKMTDIIAQDPALSLGILKVANSVIYNRVVKCESVQQAVTRIGLRQIKSIATSIAVQQMFKSKNPIIEHYLQHTWQQSVTVATIAASLLTFYLRSNKHANLTTDIVTLAALIHNIGILPILTEAENHDEVFSNKEFLQQVIGDFSNKIGATVTKYWGFSDVFSELVLYWNDFQYLPKEVHYLDFIRAGAIYHGLIPDNFTSNVLLESYVEKGILPDIDFMSTHQFSEVVSDIRASLN